MDERTLREVYLPLFEAAVKQAHVGAIMDSYNLINGQHAMQNGYFNTEIVRKEWVFDGVMMSDWVGDLRWRGGGKWRIRPGNADGSVHESPQPSARDRGWTRQTGDHRRKSSPHPADRRVFGCLDRPQGDLSISTYNEQNHQLALQAAREGMVLLKNDGNVLPLDKQKIKTVLMVGPDAYPGEPVGAGSARVVPFAAVSPVQGISSFLGSSVNVFYEAGLPSVVAAADATKFVTETKDGKPGLKLESFRNVNLSGKPESTQVVRHLNEPGTTWNDLVLDPESLVEFFSATPKPASKRWTGYFVASPAGAYEVVAQGWGEGGGYRLYVDDKLIFDNWKLSKAFQDGTMLQLSAGPHKVVGETFLIHLLADGCAWESSSSRKSCQPPQNNWQPRWMQ